MKSVVSMLLALALIVATSLCFTVSPADAASNMQIGVGIGDVTGQVTELGFMGYAALNQIGTGLHFRSRARAFIFVDGKSGSRVVYVSMDLCMGFEMLKTFIVEKLQSEFGPNLYTRENLILSGTHTHSAPGGMGGTVLVDITNFGFSKDNFNIAVNGVVNAVRRAHNAITPARILLGEGELKDASINRSPASYEMNPQAERDQYTANVEQTMTVLRFAADDGRELGMIAFFAVHPVSMNNTNTLSSGDNKGLASMLFESMKNGPMARTGQGPFVAAFGQANPGDVSPNTNGPKCPDGSPCDYVHSTCGGKTEGCIASGPGKDMYESTFIIGSKQKDMASTLYDNATLDVTGDGSVDFRHTYVNMQNVTIDPAYTSTSQTEMTCEPAMGYGFAGGTTDGPGAFDFTQGQLSPNPFWAFVSGFLSKPTQAQVDCQAPKPILLNVGGIGPALGGEWTPHILPLQVARIGDLFFVAVPGEFTTMSWRRLKKTVIGVLQENKLWGPNSRVLINGLSNSYSHYIATYEEYQLQRYEGGSTIYGPHTLAAYQQEYAKIVSDLATGAVTPHGPTPEDMRNRTISFVPGVIVDGTPEGINFGAVQTQPAAQYSVGQTASVVFWCASPRNDPLTDATYLFVESVDTNGNAKVVADDSAWETRFHWKRQSVDQSLCTIQWVIPAGTPTGAYRIRTFGTSKSVLGIFTPFQGLSNNFNVVQ